jgi:hypothetical protein
VLDQAPATVAFAVRTVIATGKAVAHHQITILLVVGAVWQISYNVFWKRGTRVYGRVSPRTRTSASLFFLSLFQYNEDTNNGENPGKVNGIGLKECERLQKYE